MSLESFFEKNFYIYNLDSFFTSDVIVEHIHTHARSNGLVSIQTIIDCFLLFCFIRNTQKYISHPSIRKKKKKKIIQ